MRSDYWWYLHVVNIAQECGNLFDHHLLHSLTIELCDFLLVATFARDDSTRLVLHGTSDFDRTLLLLELLHFFLKIHRLQLIALDRCGWPRTSSRAVGLSPSCNFVKHVIFGSLCTLWTIFRIIDSKLPCWLRRLFNGLLRLSCAGRDLLFSTSCPCPRHPSLFHHASWWSRRAGPEALESRHDGFCHSLLDPLRGSLLRREGISPLFTVTDGVCKELPPNTENSMQYGYEENDNNNMSNETKRETNYSMNNKWREHAQLHAAHKVQQVHQWRRSHRRLRGAHHTLSSHIARTLSHLFMSSHTSLGQDLSLVINISIVIHERTSLSRFSSSTSTCPFLSSSFHSTSCTASCTLSSTTWSPWKACATPPTRRVTTPTTSPPPSQVSATLQDPSPTLSRHRTRTWMTRHSASCSQRHTEDKPITANQKACQSVSRRRLLCSMDQGNLMKKEMSTNQLVLVSQETRTALTASFLKTPKLRKWSTDQGNLRSEIAQMHRLGLYLKNRDRWLSQNIARKLVITNSKQLMQKKSAEFRQVHQQNLTEVEELRKLQSSTSDTIARRKLIEDQNTILELSGRVQEQQNEVNCMNDSKDFQDAESVRSGNSHVTSRPMSFPPHPVPEGMFRHSFVSPRRKEGPPSIWDTHGISGNVFANPPASSSAPYPQELNQWSASVEEPLHSSTVEKSERPEQNQDLRCQSGPSAKDSVILSVGDYSKNYEADQQRLQISDLHFDKFPHQLRLLAGRSDSRPRYVLVHNSPTEAVQWIKEVEMVDSVDDWRSSPSMRGISMPKLEVPDARIASALNKIIRNSHFKRRNSLEEQKAQKQEPFPSWQADCLLDLRLLLGHWNPWFCRELCRPIHYQSTKRRYLGIWFEMGRNFIVHDENPAWWHLGRFVQIKNTSVWETEDRIGIVWPGDSSEEVRTWLSQIEIYGEKKYRARNSK